MVYYQVGSAFFRGAKWQGWKTGNPTYTKRAQAQVYGSRLKPAPLMKKIQGRFERAIIRHTLFLLETMVSAFFVFVSEINALFYIHTSPLLFSIIGMEKKNKKRRNDGK